MHLSRRAAALLLAFGVWSWIIWPTFLRNIAKDDRSFDAAGHATGFLIVHALLTGASLLFGTAIGVLGVRGLRATSGKAQDEVRPAGTSTRV